MVERCFNEMTDTYGCIKSTLRWLISDGIYDEAILESILQEIFPERLFDHLPNTISGARFALTATSFGNSRWIFGNYNAASPKPRTGNVMNLLLVPMTDIMQIMTWCELRILIRKFMHGKRKWPPDLIERPTFNNR